jgi:Protein of unknown function (DUF2568)
LKQLNLLLKFALELVALAGFALGGASFGSGAVRIVVAIAAPVAVAILWGAFAAPHARRRLRLAARAPFELGVFLLAALAYWRAETIVWALGFAAVVAANSLLLTLLGQWEA